MVFFYKILLFLKIPGAFGWAIIALTVLVRIILHPFFRQQIEMAKKMQELKPQLDKISQKHKNDKKTLQQEQLKLYQQAGINPASGCLFMIIQIPIFIALYNTLSLFLMNGNTGKIISEINQALYWSILKIEMIDPWFFGLNLAMVPAKGGEWYYYLVPIITGVLQYWQFQASVPISADNKRLSDKTAKKQKTAEKQNETEDFQKAMNTQMKFIFPMMIGWFSYTLPVGLSLYWNIFSLFSIIQYKNLKVQSSNIKT